MIEAVAKCLKKLSFSKAVCGAAGLLSEGLRVTGQRQLVSKGDLQLFTEAVEGEGLGVGLTGAEGGLGGAETQDLPLPHRCPLPTVAIWGGNVPKIPGTDV